MEMKPFQEILTKYERKVAEIMKLIADYEIKESKKVVKSIDEAKLQQ